MAPTPGARCCERSAATFPAVAVDLPGFGRADRVAPGPYLKRLDEFVAELLRASASDAPVVAVGNSLGGVAVLRAAHDASLPLAGIVPISPAGLGYAPWVDLVSREPIIHHILTLPIPLPEAIIRQALSVAMRRLAYGDPSRADPDVLRRYASHHPRAGDLRSIIKRARILLAELGVGYAALESITVPVQMIWGGNATSSSPSPGRRCCSTRYPAAAWWRCPASATWPRQRCPTRSHG
ncbi:alpha/beta fold hydrolase [Conexibacter sp. W3-3-2]|uniref:alpha/beta fold hydrolase n=1 Tax=Conexibacter sp. W3-3-2 TaxID=2675227 RepID=UPI00281561D6|nr:alpha/beta fold hydrolase [Conexibacter sp. W3-3-2]